MTSEHSEAAIGQETPTPSIDELINTWQNGWVSPRTGPLYSANLYDSPTYKLVPEEQMRSEEPEREAYRQLVNGVASMVAAQAREGDKTSVIEELRHNIPHVVGKNDTLALFGDVFTRTLDLLIEPDFMPVDPTLPKPFQKFYPESTLVSEGEYRLLNGADGSLQFKLDDVHVASALANIIPDPDIPGVRSVGFYGESISPREVPAIIAFRYHKKDAEGNLETTDRCIIWRGIGFGVHPGHAGQEPTWYLVGSQIGTIDPETGDFEITQDLGEEVIAKSFSVACITGGPFGEPVLANPAQS